jgi:hypothetical protein
VTKLGPGVDNLLPDGSQVEDFGFSVNLMLALASDKLVSSLAEAIELAKTMP